jgi:hypothetical protein
VTTQTTQQSQAAASWLFIKDSQSIWVERPHGRLIVVAGPGSAHEQRDFISEEALDQFQIALAERLAGDGWFLWGVNKERRTAADRRKSGRGTPDRRTART